MQLKYLTRNNIDMFLTGQKVHILESIHKKNQSDIDLIKGK